MKNKLKTILISLVAVAVCSLLVFTTLDHKIADNFQRSLNSTVEDKSVVMINVDDTTINNIGTYPLSRDVYGKSLIVLKDLGVEAAVFDINFFDKSPIAVDVDYYENHLETNIQSSFRQLKGGRYSVDKVQDEVLVSVHSILSNPDDYFAKGLKFFDNSFLNVTYIDTAINDTDDETRSFIEENFALKNIIADQDNVTPEHEKVSPCLLNFISCSAGAGSVNGDPDKDGMLRRVHLLHKYHGKYYPQLAFAPLLKKLGDPQIIVSDENIVLVDAKIDENTTKTIAIPRGEDGAFILKFPAKVYDEYNAISLWNIYRLFLLEKQFTEVVQYLNSSGIFKSFEENPCDYLDGYMYLREELFNGEDEENEITYENYYFYRQAFFDAMKNFLGEDKEHRNFSDEDLIAACEIYDEYISSFEKVKKQLEGTIATFGVVATGTTDVGLNQYEKRYPNTGAHYTILNQILSEDFVDDSASLYGIVVAVILCLLYALIALHIKGTGRQIIFGICVIVLTFACSLGYFVLTRTYFTTSVPVVSLIVTFVAITVIGFLTASKDKKFITNAFSQCLSKEVVKEIVANPSSFKLGGQKLEMTAIFTDIQKFSSFSELLTASQLVALLNFYLTQMSDIIMDERGTVDKYEGDAIIALVGAPVAMKDHAVRAVTASLKMKAAEIKMNEHIKEVALNPKSEDMEDDLYDAFKIMVENDKSIFTRIGLNSGEMIAGYMGSENKKNYTMMGNNVNLASRLEGVNKQYSTGGILMSEATRNLLEDKVIVRRLDRVRVVNVNTPIRLYEPLCLKENATEDILKYVQSWEFAMDTFEDGQYDKALEMFNNLSSLKPNDNTAKYYIKLIEMFFIKGRYPTEADNFGVEYMEQDKVFKLLQK